MVKSITSQSAIILTANDLTKKLGFVITAIILLFVFTSSINIFAQTVLVHHAGVYEDGNPKYDADGNQNGVIIWGPGIIHVVYHCPFQRASEILKILPGAIVKIAGSVTTDTSGNIVSWSPGGKLYLFNELEGVGGIQIDGATITDIRDDLVGGDTNKDGNASLIGDSDVNYPQLIFPKNGNNYLLNSTVKYMDIKFCNTMAIENNHFHKLMRMGIDPYYRPAPYSAPNICNNVIEFWLNSSTLNLYGLSPVVDGNTFRYAEGVTNDNSAYIEFALNIGELAYTIDQNTFPIANVTRINNNTFETTNGIYCGGWIQGSGSWTEILFPAEITNNTITGKSKASDLKTGITAIRFPSHFNISVQGNVISNFVTYLNIFNHSGITECQIHINKNQFILNPDGFSNNPVYGPNINRGYDSSVYPVIDATYNYWGAPSGPIDSSAVDGFWNPRGKGLDFKQAAYINYIPFIGGAAPEDKDNIHITAVTIDPLPENNLLPDLNATIRVDVDKYNLATANSGKIVVYVQDDAGFYYNLPGAEVDVTANNTVAGPIDITFKVPITAKIITITAILYPEGDLQTTTSNVINFKVEQFENKLKIVNIKGLQNGEKYVNGNNYNLDITIEYSLITSSPTVNGSIEIDIHRFIPRMNEVRKYYDLITIPVEPTANSTIERKSIPIKLDLLDDLPWDEYLGFIVKLKDDSGVFKTGAALKSKIYEACESENINISPAYNEGGTAVKTGNRDFMLGNKLCFIGDFEIKTDLKAVNDLQLVLKKVTYYEGITEVISDQLNYVCSNDLMTGIWNYSFAVITDKIIPGPADRVHFDFIIKTSDSNIELLDITWFKEIVNLDLTVAQNLPTGSSTVQFSPVRSMMKVTSNTQEGELTAGEVNFPFSGTNKLMKAKSSDEIMSSYWEFIPINSYWLVYESQPVGDVTGTISFQYDPAIDFPANPLFDENTLVIAGLNPYSGELEALATSLNKESHMVTANYEKFFQTWIVASLNSGELTGAGQPSENENPTNYELRQNFPNPFNPTTTIVYSIPTSVETLHGASLQHVTLKIYDILGKEIATLVNEQKAPGYYEAEFDASRFSSGVYFYRIQSGDFLQTKKMLLLK